MDQPWTVTERLETELAQWLATYERSYGEIGYPVYPSVMWSLGGEARRNGGARIKLPSQYSAGFYRRDPLPEGDGLVLVPSETFGLVVFLPREEDRASDRRLIDFDGKDILVR